MFLKECRHGLYLFESYPYWWCFVVDDKPRIFIVFQGNCSTILMFNDKIFYIVSRSL